MTKAQAISKISDMYSDYCKGCPETFARNFCKYALNIDKIIRDIEVETPKIKPVDVEIGDYFFDCAEGHIFAHQTKDAINKLIKQGEDIITALKKNEII